MGGRSKMEIRKQFDTTGYLYVPNAVDFKSLYCSPPVDKEGQRVHGNERHSSQGVEYNFTEPQVKGSLERYNHPLYKRIHYSLMKKIEGILSMDLLPTYYYDRFYYEGQKLGRHTDRPSCEISATVQISTNRDQAWPIWFQHPDQTENSVSMKNGDMVLYRGCEREHWREPLTGKNSYHHQIFFHYVNAQGPYVHYAYDRGVG